MSRISVYVRVRPILSHEKEQQTMANRVHLITEQDQICIELSQKRQKVFTFDGIIPHYVTQQEVYQNIQMDKLVNRVVEGYHSTIFAYGQTGSGKTYTIQGQNNIQNMGLIPRSIHNMFFALKNRQNTGFMYKVYISFLQIYNEQIFDLIDASKKPLKMRWNKYQQFLVQNLFQGQCRDQNQAIQWWKIGQKSKIIDSHNMNKQSSRSHCILTLKVKCFQLEDPSNVIQSKLQIVDLAGSQRQKITKSTGIVFREGIQINKSLFSLRQVIAALYESNVGSKTLALPPYRDSKLTSLLKQSIGGNAFCAMIACLNPTLPHFEESLQTLTYASMATFINNAPSRNIDPKIKQNEHLKQQNYNLKEQIKRLSRHIQVLTNFLQNKNCQKCGSNYTNIDNVDSKPKSRKDSDNISEFQSDFKLPRFNTSDNRLTKLIKKNQSQLINQSQLKNIKAFSPQRIDRDKSFTTNNEPDKKSQMFSDVQLKNPKEILQSISMIRDLIHNNTKFRDKIQSMRELIQKMEKQNFQIMQENQILRDQLDKYMKNQKIDQIQEENNSIPNSLYGRLLKQQKIEALKSAISVHSTKNRQKNSKIRSKTLHQQDQLFSVPSNIDQSPQQYVIYQRPYNEILRQSSTRKKKNSIEMKQKKRNNSNIKKFESTSFLN